jgi:hypothetical protein
MRQRTSDGIDDDAGQLAARAVAAGNFAANRELRRVFAHDALLSRVGMFAV